MLCGAAFIEPCLILHSPVYLPAVLPSKLGLLGNLTNLTELVLYGTSALSTYQVQQLPQLRSLRKLGFTIKATTPSLGPLENLELDFVPELDLG